MKKVIKILSLFIIGILLLVLVPGLQDTRSKIMNFVRNENHVVSLTFQDESLHIKMREKEKTFVKNSVKRIKTFIFREATEHNPPGDLVPDAIDDNVMDSIKKHFD